MSLPVTPPLVLLYAFLALFNLTSGTYTKVQINDTVTVGSGLQPKVVIDDQGVVKIVYGLEDNLFFVESKDKGKTFTKPTLVAELPEGLMLGMGRGPQILSWGKNTVITAVNEQGNMYSWKLNSLSRKWEGPNRINDADTVAKEGFIAIAKGKGNTIYTAWNDLRNGHNQIYGSVSKDGGKTWGKNKRIYASPDTTICECCKISMVADNRGKVYVMWRNQLNGYRDMYLMAMEEDMHTLSAPEKLGRGTWNLKGCPMDGGNLYSDEKGNILTVWRRESDIFLCEPGKEEVKLGRGKTPAITRNKLGTQVVWGEKNEIVAFSSGATNSKVLGKGRNPGIVSRGDLTFAFWETENKEMVVKRLDNF